MHTAKHPFDYDLLKKGTIIPERELVEVTGLDVDHKDFALELLKLQGQIEQELSQRNLIVTVARRKNSLVILEDQEASVENHRRTQKRIRGMMRDHRRMLGVDRSKLETEDRDLHDKRVVQQAQMIVAIKTVRRQIKLPVHKDHRPKLT